MKKSKRNMKREPPPEPEQAVDYTGVRCERCHSHWLHCTCKDPKLVGFRELAESSE